MVLYVAGISQKIINELVQNLQPMVCPPRETVIREGEDGQEMYFVARGELIAVPATDPSKVLRVFTDGTFFGEW